MAEIVDQLRLDIDAALRDIDRIEQALDRALAPIEIRVDPTLAQRQLDQLGRDAEQTFSAVDVDIDPTEARQSFNQLAADAERALSDVDVDIDASGAARLNSELAGVERNLAQSDREAEQLAGSLREADRAADRINVTAGRTAGAFGSLRIAAAGIASVLAAVGGAQIFGAAIRGAQAAISQFTALNESINAVRVTFGDASGAVFQFGEQSAQSAGLSAQAFQQAVVPIGAVLTNFGFQAQEAASASIELVQRAADLASVFNTDVNEALLAINSALVGQVEPLRRYGAEISQARVQAFALANGLLQAGEEMDTATAVQARFGLILADTNRVAGDFTNTSDELANAQRVAAASVQEFAADIGEQLAPALESIVVLLPELLEGLRQLVPAFAAGADSAAAFFEAAGRGGGFRTEFALLNTAFEISTEGLGALGEISRTVFATWRGDTEEAREATGRFFGLLQQQIARGVAIQLARSLDSGTDAVEAFNTAIIQTARGTANLEVFTRSYRDFSIVAGLSALELRDVTQELIDNADQIGLTGDEIDFLVTQLALLNSALFTDIEAVREFNRATRELAEDDPLKTVGTRFVVFTDQLAEIPDQMQSVAVRMRTAAAAIGEALNPFDEAAATIEVSAREFFQNLTDQINREAQFQAGLVELILREQFNLAEALGAQGPAAQQALEEFLADVNLAEAAEAALSGQGTELSLLIEDTLTKAIADASTPEIRQALIDLLGLFTNTQVRDAIVTGSASAATRGISEFRQTLLSGADQLIPEVGDRLENLISQFWPQEDAAELAGEKTEQSYIDGVEQDLDRDLQAVFADVGIDLDLFDDGVESRLTFFAGLSTPQPGEASNLRSSITATIDSAIFRDSPPKLFLDIGKESGDAFWSGFNQSELTLRTAVPAITGRIATTSTSAAVGLTGPLVQLTLNNSTVQDAVSDTARLAQIANSVAQTYNSVRPV